MKKYEKSDVTVKVARESFLRGRRKDGRTTVEVKTTTTSTNPKTTMVMETKQQTYPDRSRDNINLLLIRKDDAKNDYHNTTTTNFQNKNLRRESISKRNSIMTGSCCFLSLSRLQLLHATTVIVSMMMMMTIDSQMTFFYRGREGGGLGGGVEALVIRHQATSSTSRHHQIKVLSELGLLSPSSSSSLEGSDTMNSSSSMRKRRSDSFQTTRRSSMSLSSSQSDDDNASSSDDDDDVEDDVYTNDEISDMHDLVVRLSLEPTDHERRIKLRDIFHDKLDSGDERFCRLFDKILTEVGDEIQMKARKRLFEQQEQDEETSTAAEADGEPGGMKPPQSNGVSIEDEDVTLPPPREKSPEELQLWALVDMMVQSKTIVKKMSGELGSKGVFQ